MALFPLGILSAAGAGGGPVGGAAYELIATNILGTAQSSFTFSNLGDYSSSYKHLQLRMVYKSDRANNSDAVFMRLNGDTGTNYSSHVLGANPPSAPFSGSDTSLNAMDQFYTAANSSTGFGAAVLDFLDAYDTSKYKTRRFLASTGLADGFAGVQLGSGSWRNTAAITSITLVPRYGSNWVANSRFSIYGIRG
jgi:hypothetical protein